MGSETVQLILTPTFSPDGLRIAFAAGSPAGMALLTVPTSGGTPARATSATTLSEVAPTWSPDGKWLAFMHNTPNGRRLAKVRVGSGEPAIDLFPTCGTTIPQWSPTGEWIAFAGQNCEASLISPDSGQTRALGGVGALAWSRDGRTLYRVDPRSHSLLAVDVATLHERTLREVGDLIPYSGPQPGLRVSVTSDGTSIVYSALRPREEIWILENVHIDEPWYAWVLSLLN